MRRIIYTIGLAIVSMLAFVSCDDEDFSGDTNLTPTSPTVSFSGVPSNATLFETDTTYVFTVNIDEPQIVDVALYINQVGGTASLGSDYVINNLNSRALISAGRTSATVSISVLADEVFEEDEELILQIGDALTANASMTPATISLTLMNVTEDDLLLDLSWSTADVFYPTGEVIEPEDMTDIDFYLYDNTGAVAASSAGLSFESILLAGTLPDGTYTLTAELWSVIELVPAPEYPSASLSFSYEQSGVQIGTWSYPDAIDLNLVCSLNAFQIATITKTGTNWSLTNDGVSLLPSPAIVEGSYTATQSDGSGWFGGATEKTVDISLTDDGTLLISDVSAGGYALCCLGFGYSEDQPAEVAVNGCLQAIVVGTGGSQISSGQSTFGLGSYDEDTQTLTVRYSDEFNNSDGIGFDLISVFVKD